MRPSTRVRPRPALPGRRALGLYAGLLLAGAGVLTACKSAPTQFFTLDPLPPSAPAAATPYVGPPVTLAAVHIPPALDREELVSESPQGVMQVHDFEHWEAPLGLSARQAMIQDLAARLPAGAVLGPSAPGGGGVATLDVDVVSFQADGGGAVMQAAWSLTLPPGRAALGPSTWRAPLAELRTGVEGSGGGATARAFSTLLAELADRLAAGLPAAVAQLAAERQAAEAAATARTTVRSTTTITTKRPR